MERIAVYCGSSRGVSAIYTSVAAELGRVLAVQGITLIYGGSSIGVMGAVADAALQAGGQVVGVIPRMLEAREISHRNLTELITVETMHERKAMMSELADGFITLPGGAGTMEEFFEVFTWTQIGLHQKPVGLLNIHQYFDKLMEFVDHMVAEGFLQRRFRKALLINEQPIELLRQMNAYEAPSIKNYD